MADQCANCDQNPLFVEWVEGELWCFECIGKSTGVVYGD